MKLENVDVGNLQLTDLPKFDKCPCELCDDGCFDRAGNKHYPECRRKVQQRPKLPLFARCPLTHYQGTFLAGSPGEHRRQACPPAPDNDILTVSRSVPMSTISSQKGDYQPPPRTAAKNAAMKPIRQVDNLLTKRTVPMQTQSHYQVEYVEKPTIPVSLRVLKDPLKDSQINITEPSAPIASQSTTRAHFKSWHSAPAQPFPEMPPVAGHILFPGSKRSFDTTTGTNHAPFYNVALTKPIVRLELNGNLRTSGTMDLRTNYREDYLTPEMPIKRAASHSSKEISMKDQNVYTRRPMNNISQTSFDFRPYSKHRPAKAADMEPFLSQITLGNAYTSVQKDSQYRLDYPGHDTNQHPRQPLAAPKDHQKPYMAPIQKMDTLTVSQRDFVPIDISTLPRMRAIPLKSNISTNDQKSPMENVTMTRYHFQPYEPIVSRRRYGEINPYIYIPPLDKFQGKTTTGETYQGRAGPPARPCIPEIQTLHQTGAQDHNTNYRVDYQPHGLSLCAAKAFTIAQKKSSSVTPISAQ